MERFFNFPPEQRHLQRRVDRFNADERLWQSLEPRRRLRHKLRPGLSALKRKALDLLEFARAKPPQDCIGEWGG